MSQTLTSRRKKLDLETAIKYYNRSRSRESLHQVAEAGEKLVHHFAHIYAPGLKNEDLIQAGYEGLFKAAQRFDPDRGVTFCTYAGHYIMGEMRHHMRREASFDRSGRVADLQQHINRVVDNYMKATGEVPSLAYISKSVNVREEGVVQAMRAGWIPLEEVDLTKIQSIKYESFRLPIEDKIALEQALNKLSELQRRVISMLYYRDMTQAQAAARLGISQRKVSRILHKSLNEMAESLS